MSEVVHPIAAPSLKARPIIMDQLRSLSTCPRAVFDPERHLSFTEQPKTLSLKEIGLPEDAGISSVAVSDPFPMFSEDAIRIMRSEIFTNEVWENCMYTSDFASCQLRGHCPKYAPFMHEAWTHPESLSIVSKIAGVDLVPVYDIEIGNINVSVQDANVEKANSEEMPVTKWHVDSYPFVCVVMMSDASNMVGGETAIKTGSGEIMKVRGPQMGCAVILQGRCITHQALAAVGGKERITMITAYRPRDALVPDDSVLTTIRPITELNELYFQWTKYRIEVLQERLQVMLKMLEQQHRPGKPTEAQRIKDFLRQQEQWLAITNTEIII